MWPLSRFPLSLLRSCLWLLRDILRLCVSLLRVVSSILSVVRLIMFFFWRRPFWVWCFITCLFCLSLRADAQASPSPSPSPYPSPTFQPRATIITSTPAATATPAFQFGDDCAGAEFMTAQQFASLSFLWRHRCRHCVERWYQHNGASPLPTSPYSLPTSLVPTSLIPTSVIPTSVIPTSVIPTLSPPGFTPSPFPSGTPLPQTPTAAPSSTPFATATADPYAGCSPGPLPTSTPVVFDQVIFHRARPYPHDWGDAVYNAWSPYPLSGVSAQSFFTITYYGPSSSYAYYSNQRNIWHLVGIYVPMDRLVYRARVTGRYTFNQHLMGSGSRQFVFALLGNTVVSAPYEVWFQGGVDPTLLDAIFDANTVGSPADGFIFGFYVYPTSTWGVLAHLNSFTVTANVWSFPSTPVPTPPHCAPTPTPTPDLYCSSPDFSSSELFVADELEFTVESSYCYQVTPRIPEVGLKGGWVCVDWVRLPRIVILGFVVDTSLAFSLILVGFILASIFRR